MLATGTFDVNLEPQNDEVAPAGRMLIHKTYSGMLEGKGVGQMISKRVEGGSAIYYAVEEFVGKLNGKSGSFTLLHKGFMNKELQSLEIEIMQGSADGELKSIQGSMKIIQDSGKHLYELEYRLSREN